MGSSVRVFAANRKKKKPRLAEASSTLRFYIFLKAHRNLLVL